MIKLIQKITIISGFVVSVLFGQLALPVVVQAADDPCKTLQNQISNGGFNVNQQLPVYCTTGEVYSKFLYGALYAVGIVAVIAMLYGGYLYMTAQSNDAQVKKGKDVLLWASIGLIVVLVASLLVNVAISLLVENRFV